MTTRKKAVKKSAIQDIAVNVAEKYNPEQYSEFIAAIKSGCLDSQAKRIEVYMQHRDSGRLGALIMQAVIDKINSWALDDVAKQYNDSLGGGDEQD